MPLLCLLPEASLLNFRSVATLVLAFVGAAATQTLSPIDTTIGEGQKIRFNAVTTKSITAHWWSVVDGLPYRILDPESNVLDVQLPRVSKNEFIRFRFTAKTGSSDTYQDILIRIVDDVPDPLFALPALRSWDGKTPLGIRPNISNLAQIKSCRFPGLRYAWKLDSVPVDTATKDSTFWLQDAKADGRLAIKLCLDNGGTVNCNSMTLTVRRPVAIKPTQTPVLPASGKPGKIRIDGKHLRYQIRSGKAHELGLIM